jgi:hypothetical protein
MGLHQINLLPITNTALDQISQLLLNKREQAQSRHQEKVNKDPNQKNLPIMDNMGLLQVVLLDLNIIVQAQETCQTLGSMDLPKINTLVRENGALQQYSLQTVARKDIAQLKHPAKARKNLDHNSLLLIAVMCQVQVSHPGMESMVREGKSPLEEDNMAHP